MWAARLGRRTVIVAVALVASRAPAPAQVITFGADLNRPVNYRFDCGVGPGVDAFGGLFLYPTNVTTCTWIGVGRNFGQAESFLVPSGVGTVTNVRVKVGPITGPMQVVVLRAIRSAQDPMNPLPPDPSDPPVLGPGVNVACCFEVGRSAPFVPAANAITNVAVNLPVKADIVPNPISLAYDFDLLGLSILAPGVPIPAHDTGNYQNLAGPGALIYFPAIGPGQERADSFGTGGFQPLLQADWVPVQVGGGGTSPAVVTLALPVATVQQNFLLLSLLCNQATPCVGGLRVQNQGVAAGGNAAALAAGRARVKRPRMVTFGKAEFTIPPGQIQEVPAKLTRKGKKMLRKSERPALYANLRFGSDWSTAGTVTIAP
jgi:hypothetical protein